MAVRSLVRRMAANPRLLVTVSFASLACAWGLSTVPFSGVDEPSQYLRTLAIARGDLVMAKAPEALRTAHLDQPYTIFLPPGGYRTEALNTRVLNVPERMAPPPLFDRCIGPVTRRSCPEATYNGTYPPAGYLLPAIGLSLASNATAGLWLGRIGAALGCLTFLFLAVALVARGGRWAVLGLLAAVSPMVLFMSSMLNPDGLEITASLAFACGCLRVAAEREQIPRWAVVSLMLSGVTSILTWALGPLYVGLSLLMLIGLLGRRGVADLLRERRAAARAVGASLVAALGLYGAWDLAMGHTHGGLELSPLLPSAGHALSQLSLVWEQSVGVVGWINVFLPGTMYQQYLLAALLILLLACRFGGRRERLMLALVTLIALVAPILLDQWLLRPPSDQGVQGRYVIPVLALVPLLAGHVLAGRAASISDFLGRVGAAIGVFLFAFIEVGALFYAARLLTGGVTPSFGAHARWAPPVGWGPWLLLTACGGGALLLWGAALLFSPDPASIVRPRRGHRMAGRERFRRATMQTERG